MKESYSYLFLIFLRFGLMAWGGPVAQIAMLRAELVERRGWVSAEKFRRALAVYQALPGPEAHELCVYLGMVRAGRWGGFLAGLGFMLPGLLLMLLLAWGYQYYGASVMLPLFAGAAPAVAALIIRAAHRIGQHILVEPSHWVAMLVAVALTLLGVHFFWVFVVCAIWQALCSAGYARTALAVVVILAFLAVMAQGVEPVWDNMAASADGNLLVEGLKAGLLSFGGAYTAIPFLQHSMVGHYPAITPQVFLDSIALGSVIPAPLVIFGTFLGFAAGGFSGAMLMTAGIFAPAFAFTLLGHALLERMMDNKALHGALDGVAAAVAGLLALTALQIALQVVNGWPQAALFVVALAVFYASKRLWTIPAVIVGCGVAGWMI